VHLSLAGPSSGRGLAGWCPERLRRGYRSRHRVFLNRGQRVTRDAGGAMAGVPPRAGAHPGEGVSGVVFEAARDARRGSDTRAPREERGVSPGCRPGRGGGLVLAEVRNVPLARPACRLVARPRQPRPPARITGVRGDRALRAHAASAACRTRRRRYG
jgi:hypothetical protein